MIKKSFFDIKYYDLSVPDILKQIDEYASAGADVHEMDQNKQNILIRMTFLKQEGSEQLITKFIQLGADMYFKNGEGNFPFYSCARCGSVKMMRAFLDAGFDLKKLTPEDKEEVSVGASYNNDPEMLKLIVELGLYDYSAHKQAILDRAILFNNDKVVQAMLDEKVDLTGKSFLDDAVFTMDKLDDDDFELMHINRNIVRSLVQAGAKLSNEKNAIYQAISKYHIAVHTIKLLNEIGVDWRVLTSSEQAEVEKVK